LAMQAVFKLWQNFSLCFIFAKLAMESKKEAPWQK
jgi:hypothetical protein